MFKLNYDRMLTDQLGVVMGPNVFEEYFIVTGQNYDPNMKRTTLELKIYRNNNE